LPKFLPVEAWHWGTFGILVVALLALDLFVFHRHDHRPSLRESAAFTVFWIAMGLLFNALVWWWGVTEGHGSDPGLKFLTGYLIEKALSMDNIFVFVVIFRFFHIPLKYQYRVLFWGILGAVFMRLAFIMGGIELFERFEFVAILFGGFLVYTAYKLARHDPGSDVHPEKNVALKLARRYLPVTAGDHHQHGNRFFVKEKGRLCITPMFLVLLVIESTDVVFAIDSVPTIIGITTDRFIAFTSNVFAILGLRALYFLLAGVIDMFCYLHYGLAAILGFIGVKMVVEWGAKQPAIFEFFGLHSLAEKAVQRGEHAHLVPVEVSLLVTAGVLAVSIIASVVFRSREKVVERGEADDS